jgi:hypothetical protein
MNKQILSLIAMLFLSTVMVAQDLKIDWSKKIVYDRFSTGDMVKFAGSNENFVYALFNPIAKDKEQKGKRYIMAYDKKSMKEMGKIKVSSATEFHNIYVTNDAIYVTYLQNDKSREELYAETYSPTLESITKRKKIATKNTTSSYLSKQINSISAKVNPKANNNLYVFTENAKEKGENVTLNYDVFNKNLEPVLNGKVTLPIENLYSGDYNTTRISIGDDGNLIAKNTIKADKQTRKSEKIYSYSMLTIIDTRTNTLNSMPIKAEGKNIIDFEYFTLNNKLHVIGFFHENKGARRERGNGVFSSVLNTATNSFENVVYTKLDDADVTFNLLYLEKLTFDKDGNTTLFATEDQNITTRTTTRDNRGNTSTTVTYENKKGDILMVSLLANGEVKWSNVLNRKMSYSALNIRDLKAVYNSDNSYVTYAEMYKEGKKKYFWNKKKSKQMIDDLTYIKIDNTNGKFVKKVLKLNTANVEKDKRKTINATAISEIDNSLYLDGFETSMKPGVFALGCATTPLCCFGMLYWNIKANNGTAFTGGGYLGAIHLD